MTGQGRQSNNRSLLWLAIGVLLVVVVGLGVWFFLNSQDATTTAQGDNAPPAEQDLSPPYALEGRPEPTSEGFFVLADTVGAFAQTSADGDAEQIRALCKTAGADTLTRTLMCDIEPFARSTHLHIASYAYAQGDVGLLAARLEDNLTLEAVQAREDAAQIEGVVLEENEDGSTAVVGLNSPIEGDAILRRLLRYVRANGTPARFVLTDEAPVKHFAGAVNNELIFVWTSDNWIFVASGPSEDTLGQFVASFPY